MKHLLLSLFALIAGASILHAETSFDFSVSLPRGWEATVPPRGFESGADGRGAQFDASSVLTLPGVANVSRVTIDGSTNTDDYTLEVRVGSTSFGTKTLSKGNEQTWEYSAVAASGDLQLVITKAKKKSVWIKTVSIDGSFDDSNLPEDNIMDGLDPDYVYAEPTLVASSDSLGSKIPYSFICNNVKVIANLGTKSATYFGANAGTMLTFVTTRKMKALVVDGFVRKAFTASASAGTLAYKSSGAVDIEEDQVLAIMDIDTNVVTINCDKQLRCKLVSIYFEANPEVDIPMDSGGDEEDDYSFEWEPQEVKTLTVTFDSLNVIDMTESLGYACTGLYLLTDDYEMELSVFASTVSDGTILPVGSYPINDSYQPGTVMASPGGYAEYDFPSYLITDFEYDEINAAWLYNTVYYLADGTLEVKAADGGVLFELQANSHFGSTIHATYSGSNPGDAVELIPDAPTSTACTKLLRNGQLMLIRNNRTYTILGQSK